ncbi:hypothetical protein PAHAL_7G223500 [Panicum hallii]|uniref:Uncharacterized protein n=1 Tax=Panicum hallii TaxID=206008 RepID=A0A2S3I8J6_9POAL|nr:hypothetical protein PAHAL_7G223500 [Panicum hallii]
MNQHPPTSGLHLHEQNNKGLLPRSVSPLRKAKKKRKKKRRRGRKKKKSRDKQLAVLIFLTYDWLLPRATGNRAPSEPSSPAGTRRSAHSSVLEAGLLPDGVADPAEVAPLERPADPLVHRKRRGPAAPRQLVRRHHLRAAAARPAVAAVVVPVELPLARVVVPVLDPEDLLPIRYVHRQRPRRAAAAVRRLLPRGAGGRDRPRPGGGQLRAGAGVHAAAGPGAGRAPDVRLVKLLRRAGAGSPRRGAPGRREHPVRVLRGRRPRAPGHAADRSGCSGLGSSLYRDASLRGGSQPPIFSPPRE